MDNTQSDSRKGNKKRLRLSARRKKRNGPTKQNKNQAFINENKENIANNDVSRLRASTHVELLEDIEVLVHDNRSCVTLEVQAIVHNKQGGECKTRLTQDIVPLEEVTVTSKAQNKVFDENEIMEYDKYKDNTDRSLPLSSKHLQQNNDEELAEEINYSTNLSTPCLSDNELIVTEEQENICETPSLEGNRLVDIGFVFSQLATMSHHPFDCNFTCMNFIKEKRVGFMSSYHFVCKLCKVEIYSQETNQKDYINASVVEGVFQTRNGYAQLDKICASLNMPNMSERYYIRICSKLGDLHRDVALQHMLEAGKEEKELAIEQGDIDTDGIPYITVITDGSWGKRSYGTNFNSLSGVGCIIGFRTKKILFIGVRKSYCCICAVAIKRKTEVRAHKCYKNWFGPSTEMETNAIVEGFKISVSMHGLKYSRLIGDGDSSVCKCFERYNALWSKYLYKKNRML